MRWLNQRYLVLVIGFAVVFLLLAVQFWPRSTPPPTYPVSRVLKYSFTIINPTSHFVEHAKFWAFTPMPISGTQRLNGVDVSMPHKTEIDSLGNQKLIFTLDKLPPFGTKIVTVKVVLDLTDTPNKINEESLVSYLTPELNVESDDPEILSIAARLKGDSIHDTLLNSYRWVRRTVKDVGFVKKDHGALQTLKSQKGDCTEFMYLFMAVTRANGIPVRGMAGYVNSESVILKPMDYHNWAEVYIDGRWWVIDTLKGIFMENASDYVATRIISNVGSHQKESTQQFFSANSSVHVRMN